MTGTSSFLVRWALLGTLILMVLSSLSISVSAAPGDLTGDIELDEFKLEGEPTEEPATVTFHGNVSFEQPFWQSATAALTVDIDKNWTTTASPTTITNRGPGTQTFQVTVEVPPSARGGEVATVEIISEFTSRFGDPMAVKISATVNVRPWVGYRLDATDPLELVLPQGGSGKIRLPLKNVGNVADTFSASVPYWYGLRPLGLTVESPGTSTVDSKETEELEFSVSVTSDAVPRLYVFDLMLDAASLPAGGEGVTEDPRVIRAEVYVTGPSPPDDPYEGWEPGDPPDTLSRWNSVFGSSAPRNNPDVDPSGSYIVYDQFTGETRVIYLGDVSGSNTRPVTHGHVDHHPILSPNGQMIAYAREPDRIIIVNHNGTELMEFGTDFGWVNLTDWSASGDRILFDSSGNIFELDLRYNSTRRLAGDPVDQWGAVYSDDGGRIFYLSYEAAGPSAEIWSMTSDGSAHRQLTFNELDERSVSVSPNGNRLAFTLEEDGGRGDRVCVMNVDGADVRYFTDLSRDVFVLRWNPKGESLIAEVSQHNTTVRDVEWVSYPWKDAGAPGGGGPGPGGGNGGGTGWWDDLMGGYGTYILVAIAVIVIAAIGGNYYRKRQKGKKDASADELRRQMELEAEVERARQRPPEDASSGYYDYGRDPGYRR